MQQASYKRNRAKLWNLAEVLEILCFRQKLYRLGVVPFHYAAFSEKNKYLCLNTITGVGLIGSVYQGVLTLTTEWNNLTSGVQ